MLLFLKFFLSHIVGDFLLQPFRWIKDKEEKKHKSPYLYLHILIHALTLALLLQFDVFYWPGYTVIISTHFIIDLLKVLVQDEKNKRLLFFTDQALHIIILIIVASAYSPVSINPEKIFSADNLLLATALILLTSVSAILIKIIISAWAPGTGDKQNDSLQNAGKYIGMLERLFVFGFIVTDHWEAVGFLLAAKSIFRFGDLKEAKDRKLTEYILIGTLFSFGFAILISLVYQRLIMLVPQ